MNIIKRNKKFILKFFVFFIISLFICSIFILQFKKTILYLLIYFIPLYTITHLATIGFYYYKKLKWLSVKHFVFMLFFFSSIYFSFHISNKIHVIQLKENQLNAVRVVKAISQFYDIERRYPPSVNVLVPKYLSSVPELKKGILVNSFTYRRYEADFHFLLSYENHFTGRIYLYDSQSKRWGYLVK